MTLYEYRCPQCAELFEKRMEVEKRDEANCPKCGHKATRMFPTLEQIWLCTGRAKKLTYPPSEVD